MRTEEYRLHKYIMDQIDCRTRASTYEMLSVWLETAVAQIEANTAWRAAEEITDVLYALKVLRDKEPTE